MVQQSMYPLHKKPPQQASMLTAAGGSGTGAVGCAVLSCKAHHPLQYGTF